MQGCSRVQELIDCGGGCGTQMDSGAAPVRTAPSAAPGPAPGDSRRAPPAVGGGVGGGGGGGGGGSFVHNNVSWVRMQMGV